MRTAESGSALTFHFCPIYGSTVCWEGEGFPGYVAVAIGNFADPNFPAPTIGGGRSHAIRCTKNKRSLLVNRTGPRT